jgi:hypothetical protein
MTSIAERIKGFVKGPEGRKLMERGRRQEAKPSAQEKLRQFADRVMGGSSQHR